jgi:hypothetical protein
VENVATDRRRALAAGEGDETLTQLLDRWSWTGNERASPSEQADRVRNSRVRGPEGNPSNHPAALRVGRSPSRVVRSSIASSSSQSHRRKLLLTHVADLFLFVFNPSALAYPSARQAYLERARPIRGASERQIDIWISAKQACSVSDTMLV